MTSDDALELVQASHTLLSNVALDECDGDHESDVVNALDHLDQVILSSERNADDVGNTEAAACAILVETMVAIDWSGVPNVDEREVENMIDCLSSALGDLSDGDAR